MKQTQTNHFRIGLVSAMVTALSWFGPTAAHANITNIIWRAEISGALAIQQFTTAIQPRFDQASFQTKEFITMVENGVTGQTNLVLALNIDMAQGQTNMYLTVYDSNLLQNSLRLTTNEVTTIIADGKNLAFTVAAPLVPSLTSSNSTWGGGFIRVAGTGRMVAGVPAKLRGNVDGAFIDNRPNDLNGTTGIVVRANLSTFQAPLRIMPRDRD